jgi:hypothetical protein
MIFLSHYSDLLSEIAALIESAPRHFRFSGASREHFRLPASLAWHRNATTIHLDNTYPAKIVGITGHLVATGGASLTFY